MDNRSGIQRKKLAGLVGVSLLTGLLSTLLAFLLKHATEEAETYVFTHLSSASYWFIFIPSVGMTVIYFTRKYLFRGKQNKGIKEIYSTIKERKEELPFYKVPSHFINGFITVISGGSTGVEVSTVVSTAAIGATAHRKTAIARRYKTELIAAGVAAGVATLFNSPLAGILFAVEVIARRSHKSILLACIVAVIPSIVAAHFLPHAYLFNIPVTTWNPAATPAILVICVLSALMAVYFTRVMVLIKTKYAKITNNFMRVNIAAFLVGISIFLLPQLFGDSYHAVNSMLHQGAPAFSVKLLALLFCFALIKPLIASLTIGAGGDGGVFAPSIIVGATIGVFVALICNHYFHANFSFINFMIFGVAAALSAAIHAPLTALFLACNLVPGGFTLFLPVLAVAMVSRYISHYFCEYTVYSYEDPSKEMYPHLRLMKLYRKTRQQH
ncbi:chloride channel protein [Chitinophaga horti]|uniref:Chloride channel protein n=1 Tax=Chitinophaga horti TaxID=2920382 RepID=A0ABY6J763_9BACT|nr:chloride channel protein [Chitinophaga horti]UYQ95524.1 chloride channel protein [Chitinophaga horti]